MRRSQSPPAQAVSCINTTSSLPHADLAKRPIDESNPVDIHQFLLDVTGTALDTGNFELFADFFYLPHEIETFGGAASLRTPQDLRAVFDNTRAQYEEAGISHRIRHCISASFQGDDTILATHVSRVMRGHQQMREPVPCHSVLKRVDGLWKVARSSYALEESDRPFDRLLTRNGKMLEISGG